MTNIKAFAGSDNHLFSGWLDSRRAMSLQSREDEKTKSAQGVTGVGHDEESIAPKDRSTRRRLFRLSTQTSSSSRVDASHETLPKDKTNLLFQRLPREIRDLIYGFVFGDFLFTFFPSEDRLGRACYRLSGTSPFVSIREEITFRHEYITRAVLHWPSVSYVPAGLDAANAIESTRRTFLFPVSEVTRERRNPIPHCIAILMACRQTYQEAFALLCKLPVFNFTGLLGIESFLSFVPPRTCAAVKKLSISFPIRCRHLDNGWYNETGTEWIQMWERIGCDMAGVDDVTLLLYISQQMRCRCWSGEPEEGKLPGWAETMIDKGPRLKRFRVRFAMYGDNDNRLEPLSQRMAVLVAQGWEVENALLRNASRCRTRPAPPWIVYANRVNGEQDGQACKEPRPPRSRMRRLKDKMRLR